jgi:hypothetical protein
MQRMGRCLKQRCSVTIGERKRERERESGGAEAPREHNSTELVAKRSRGKERRVAMGKSERAFGRAVRAGGQSRERGERERQKERVRSSGLGAKPTPSGCRDALERQRHDGKVSTRMRLVGSDECGVGFRIGLGQGGAGAASVVRFGMECYADEVEAVMQR